MSDDLATAMLQRLQGHWLCEDATRAMLIMVADPGVVEVTVWRRVDQHMHLERCPARWHPPKPDASASRNARQRIGYLQVEVGTPSLGTTYDLMPAMRNGDPSTFGGFEWIPLAPDTARADVRLFPEGGASYYEAVLGYYDDTVEAEREADEWMQPLSTWLPVQSEPIA